MRYKAAWMILMLMAAQCWPVQSRALLDEGRSDGYLQDDDDGAPEAEPNGDSPESRAAEYLNDQQAALSRFEKKFRSPEKCPENTKKLRDHCICPTSQHCRGSHCSEAHRAGSEDVVEGFRVDCLDCYCEDKDASAPSSGSSPMQSVENAPAPTDDDASAAEDPPSVEEVDKIELAHDQTSAQETQLQEKLDGLTKDRDVIFVKFHKVGSTTVASTLERYADRHDLQLCRRQAMFFESLPCQVWNTHDTETVLATAGLVGLRFFLSRDPYIFTLMRDPADRILSRFFYDYARVQQAAPPLSVDVLKDWLAEHPLERHHYLRTLSQGTMNMEFAKNTLQELDAVGITAELDRLMVVVAEQLKVPLEEMVYRNEKVVVGRPKLEELNKDVLNFLRGYTSADAELFGLAEQLAASQAQAVAGFEEKLASFRQLQEKVDQQCRFQETQSKVNTGLDCYVLKD